MEMIRADVAGAAICATVLMNVSDEFWTPEGKSSMLELAVGFAKVNLPAFESPNFG